MRLIKTAAENGIPYLSDLKHSVDIRVLDAESMVTDPPEGFLGRNFFLLTGQLIAAGAVDLRDKIIKTDLIGRYIVIIFEIKAGILVIADGKLLVQRDLLMAFGDQIQQEINRLIQIRIDRVRCVIPWFLC